MRKMEVTKRTVTTPELLNLKLFGRVKLHAEKLEQETIADDFPLSRGISKFAKSKNDIKKSE